MKTKKKVLLAFTTIVVCLALSVITTLETSKSNYTSASIKSICADKTGDTTRGIKSI